MGFNVQLISVHGKESQAIHRELKVAPTGRREDVSESPITGANLPNGDYLLYLNNPDNIEPEDGIYRNLSINASLVACFVHEGMMVSYACEWADGVEQWSVIHDTQQNAKHLKTRGTLPQQFESIRERFFEEQKTEADVDYIFEIPIELFVAVGGVRYDQDIPGAGPEPFEVLEKVGVSRPMSETAEPRPSVLTLIRQFLRLPRSRPAGS
jgi:hypothetical protein